MFLGQALENAIIHNDRPTPEVTINIRQSIEDRTGEWVKVVIGDNGPGIPENEQKTIESGEETQLQHGSGFGLWIVYWAVSLLGGEVTLEDNSPRGTRVILNLPKESVS